MKVVCINDNWEPKRDNPAPSFMQECNVLSTVNWFGSAYYKLIEFPSHLAYSAENFATLPDATADEMQEAEKEAKLM